MYRETFVFAKSGTAEKPIVLRGAGDGEAILLSLSKAGICVSSGSACSTGMVEPSYVLRAMGQPDSLAHGAIRFSFSRDNTEADVDQLLQQLPPVIEQLRAMSPFWKKQTTCPPGECDAQ